MTKDAVRQIADKFSWRPEFRGLKHIGPRDADCAGDTLLHLAAYSGVVADIEVLLDAGAEINRPGDIGNTALHYAAMAGHHNAVVYLLSRGADPAHKNENGDTAMNWAQTCGREKVIEELRLWRPAVRR